MVEHALLTRVQLTGTLERTTAGPGGSAHCLRVEARPGATAAEPWFLDAASGEVRRESFHDRWPEALRPAPGEPLAAVFDRLHGQVISVSGVLLTPDQEPPLVAVGKVRVAAVPGRGLGLDTLRVVPTAARAR